MRNRPAYAVEAVDHALHLATLLRQEGSLRVTDAAAALGVSRSTAHRLLVTLVYRDFAEQAPDRSYRPGPFLVADPGQQPTARLRAGALPYLNQVAAQTGESCNLQVRVGARTNVVAYVEGPEAFNVGDRFTREWDARLTSAGRILLAELGEDELGLLYPDDELGAAERRALRLELERSKARGFAINDQLTERGVVAVAVLVRTPQGAPLAGLALAMPKQRFEDSKLPTWVGALTAASALLTRDLDRA